MKVMRRICKIFLLFSYSPVMVAKQQNRLFWAVRERNVCVCVCWLNSLLFLGLEESYVSE